MAFNDLEPFFFQAGTLTVYSRPRRDSWSKKERLPTRAGFSLKPGGGLFPLYFRLPLFCVGRPWGV
jgi:hypothetical protein